MNHCDRKQKKMEINTNKSKVMIINEAQGINVRGRLRVKTTTDKSNNLWLTGNNSNKWRQNRRTINQ